MGKTNIFMGSYTEFVRNEIFTLLRWTASLSTFLIAVSFGFLAYEKGFNDLFTLHWFCTMIGFLLANVLMTWWRIKRMIFKFYNELDHRSMGLKPKVKDKTLKTISKNAQCWECVTWGLFGVGVLLFVWFLISYFV